jgi:hypothetical protein
VAQKILLSLLKLLFNTIYVSREGLRQKGFSEGATSHISKSVRQSTGIVYEAKWAILCNWCSGRDIDPVRVTVQQLAVFLVYLFEIKQLVPSTIKGYRSAIGITISLLGGVKT